MKERTDQWWSCDGHGGTTSNLGISRRSLLQASALGAVSWISSQQSALSQVTLSKSGDVKGDTVIVIFLRGGMDGLNAVIPYRQDAYFRARPSLSLSAPQSRVSTSDRCLDLDGEYGLHPTLRPFMDLFHDGEMAILHAIGSQDQTRSHFEAMNAMERGVAEARVDEASGWLARYLSATQSPADSPLRAIALGSTMPDSLRGATGAIALNTIEDFKLKTSSERARAFGQSLEVLYSKSDDAIAQAGQDTLQVLRQLNQLDFSSYATERQAIYPNSDLGNGLKQVAMLMKADVGLQVACLEKGGWDTHVAQGKTSGWMSELMDDLAKSVRAFRDDLGSRMKRVSIVIMTEFGRRVEENAALGTDHGRGSVMFVLGGAVKGGKVYANWPGIEVDDREGPGDLRVTTDYRAVLSELVRKRMHFGDVQDIFPNFKGSELGLFAES